MSMLETVEEKQDRLALLATEINTIKSQTQKIMMQASVEIGKRLAEAKGAVGHGNWEAWLQTNVDYSQRTASNLIKIYEEYGLGQQKLFGKEVNPQSLATLTYTQAVALLGIHDADERAEFVETHDVENMSSRELQKAIKERDEAKEELKAAAEALDKRIEERDKAQEELAKTTKKIHELKEEMAESKADSPNDTAIHNLEVQLAVAKGRAKELEKNWRKYRTHRLNRPSLKKCQMMYRMNWTSCGRRLRRRKISQCWTRSSRRFVHHLQYISTYSSRSTTGSMNLYSRWEMTIGQNTSWHSSA